MSYLKYLQVFDEIFLHNWFKPFMIAYQCNFPTSGPGRSYWSLHTISCCGRRLCKNRKVVPCTRMETHTMLLLHCLSQYSLEWMIRLIRNFNSWNLYPIDTKELHKMVIKNIQWLDFNECKWNHTSARCTGCGYWCRSGTTLKKYPFFCNI